MKLSDLEISVERITDAEGKSKVILDQALWEEILTLLEDLEDTEELRQARLEGGEFVPWEEVEAEILSSHPELHC
jgi:hypothetical protein